MQGVNEIRSLCSQLPLGWWDHLCTLRVVPYIPSHLLCPLARSFSLGSHCSCWPVRTVRETASDACAGDQEKPLLPSAAQDLFQIRLPFTCFPSKTYLPKPRKKQIYGCAHPAAWSCNCLTLSLSMWLYRPRRAWESAAQADPHPRWHKTFFFFLKHR